MLCVIAFYSGDKPQAVHLANWIAELGGVSTHDCLLVVDTSTDAGGIEEPLRTAFRSVTVTTSEPAGQQGTWGNGTTDATAANEMWITAGNYVFHKIKKPWCWLETDAVPTRPTWLDEIESEYQRAGKPFLGAYVNIPPHEPHMTGIGVYPPCVADHSLDMAIPNKIAWDYAGRRDTVGKKKAHFTQLIQHEYRINGESPTFPTAKSLSVIRPNVAIFHRCKDSTLIDRLREIRKATRGAQAIAEKIVSEHPLQSENEALKKRIELLEEQIARLNNPRLKIPEMLPAKPYTPAQLRGKPGKKKRVMSEAHRQKLKDAWARKKLEQL